MASLSTRLKSLLDQNGVAYEAIRHAADYTAQETAAHTHTKGREFAKPVVLRVDGAYVMAVVPAHRKVDLRRVRQALGAKEARLATEEELRKICPDCELGAEPPFGNLYDLPVYVSPELAHDERITFNAGTHMDALRIRWEDYERLVRPKVLDLSH